MRFAPVSNKKTAHPFLKDARQAMFGPPMVEHRDISEQPWWKGYVLNRPDRAQIVGDGIIRAQWRFLAAKDPNAANSRHDLDRNVATNRFDLILERVDDVYIRLHPASASHGTPVVGKLNDWILSSTQGDIEQLASSSSAKPPGATFDAGAIGKQDYLSSGEAFVWLSGLTPPPISDDEYSLCADITDASAFRWHHFLAGRPWGKALVNTVTVCSTVYITKEQKHGVLLQTNDGKQHLVHVTMDRAWLKTL